MSPREYLDNVIINLRPERLRYSKPERLRCSKCGIFVKKPAGVSAGEDYVTYCTRGHSVTYHRPAIYFVQAFRDPITGIEGNDANKGLSIMKPLKTIAEAIRRCEPHDLLFLPPQETNSVAL